MAYNLVTAFQRTCLAEEWQSLTLSKLRHRLFWLPVNLLGRGIDLFFDSQIHPSSKSEPMRYFIGFTG